MTDFETFKSRYPGFAAHHEAFAARQQRRGSFQISEVRHG